jgi:predicted lipoprotein
MRLSSILLVAGLLVGVACVANAEQQSIEAADSEAVQEGIQKIMAMDPKTIQAAIGMGTCVQKTVGMDGMQRLAEDGKAFEEEMIALCEAGKRDEAADLQQRFAARMKRSGDYEKMQSCYNQYKAHLKDPALTSMHRRVESFENGRVHVCDS